MKLLVFADLHGEVHLIKQIMEKAKESKPDILVCGGDLSNFVHNLNPFTEALNTLELPVLMLHGNHESEHDINILSQKYKNIINLHKGAYEKDNFIFFGHGGGGFSRRDEEFERIAVKFRKDLDPEKHLIFLTHAPPYDTKLDDMGMTGNVGSKSYREFIEQTQPILNISGHIHDNFGKKDKIGKTIVLNPGNKGLIINI
jgi:uncharacterized protein